MRLAARRPHYMFEGDLTARDRRVLRTVVAEADADHDVMSRVTALLVLPHALAFQDEASAARAAAEAAIDAAAELGDVYVGAIYICVDDRAPCRR